MAPDAAAGKHALHRLLHYALRNALSTKAHIRLQSIGTEVELYCKCNLNRGGEIVEHFDPDPVPVIMGYFPILRSDFESCQETLPVGAL